MGDGSLVGYTGAILKQRLEGDAVAALRDALDRLSPMSESEEVGRRVKLPRGAERPIAVFINGVEVEEGPDYVLRGTEEILFSRPIVKEKVGGARWLAMFLGLFGSYGKNEVIDIHYGLGGQTKVASDVKILP